MAHHGPPRAARRRRRWAVCAALGAVTLLAAATASVCWWRRPPLAAPSVAVEDPDPVEPAAPDPGYLGPQACAPCHAARVAEFRATSHFRACRVPQDGPMAPG